MRRVIGWIVGVAAVVGAVSICAAFNADMGRVREIREERRARPTATPSFEERCFSAWDGSVRDVVEDVKAQLVAPDTFEHQETRYTNLRDDGTFGVRMVFTAKNALGVPLRRTVTGSVDPATCQASGVLVTG